MFERRKRLFLTVRKHRKENSMDTDKTDSYAFIALIVLLVGLAFSITGTIVYKSYLRTTYLEGSTDPIEAACAFDSGEQQIPPSCMAYMLQQKELLR